MRLPFFKIQLGLRTAAADPAHFERVSTELQRCLVTRHPGNIGFIIDDIDGAAPDVELPVRHELHLFLFMAFITLFPCDF